MAISKKAKAIERVRDELHRALIELDPAEYREVLEAVADDIAACLESPEAEEADRDGWKPMRPTIRMAYRFMRGDELVTGAGAIVAWNDQGQYRVDDDRGHTITIDRDHAMLEKTTG